MRFETIIGQIGHTLLKDKMSVGEGGFVYTQSIKGKTYRCIVTILLDFRSIRKQKLFQSIWMVLNKT